MTFPAISLNLLIGPTIPVPVPKLLLDALESVEVTHSDEGRSGFQIVFRLEKGSAGLVEFALSAVPAIRVGFRVVIIVSAGPVPRVLMDGIIADQQIKPAAGGEPGSLTLTGEDVSVMMDREEKDVEHLAQPEMAIAYKIIGQYARYGLIPIVIPPPSIDVPLPVERVPVQQGTDLAYLQEIAQRYAYVFYVTPGPAPLTNKAYWGPPIRIGVPQPALTVDMGSATNVSSINFQYDGLKATTVSGEVQDRTTNQRVPVQTFVSLRPPLALMPALAQTDFLQKRIYRASGGLNAVQAASEAQAETECSQDVLTAEGELDAVRYGHILQARGLVGLRGAGYSLDGLYYVKQVTHTISPASYVQKFSLAREGLGTTVPVVRT